LRFAEAGTKTFLASGGQKIPPLVYLSKLLTASNRVMADKDPDEDLRLLLAPGSSLGGARPKAAATDVDGNLHIVKFPQAQDEYIIERWSFLAHRLAAKAGINVPPSRIVKVNQSSVLVVSRFDSKGAVRREAALPLDHDRPTKQRSFLRGRLGHERLLRIEQSRHAPNR
jgi:serine/threonine-protein kinase HipA